jgi:hypothetical protein
VAALRPGEALVEQALGEAEGEVGALRVGPVEARQHQGVGVGLGGGLAEDGRERPHVERELAVLEGGQLPVALEEEAGLAAGEQRNGAAVVHRGGGHLRVHR